MTVWSRAYKRGMIMANPPSALAHRPTFMQKLIALPMRHLQQAIGSLGDLWRTPFTTLMTIIVLGISLTLPATLHVFVKNAQSISHQWHSASQITLYLKLNISEKSAQAFVQRVELYPEVDTVTFISAKQAMEEFSKASGFGNALGYLDNNPLPATVLVTPTKRHSQSLAAQELLEKLQQERVVELGQLDLEWLTRLEAIASLIEDIVLSIALLLCASVVLIIGNTIRLQILNQKQTIAVMKLVGATDSFIQRPFLYAGMWYGISGGLLATVLIWLLVSYLSDAISRLTEVYQQSFEFTALSGSEILVLLVFAVGLGLLGSYISVRKHIKAIEPSAE